jgi:hypothetical protein
MSIRVLATVACTLISSACTSLESNSSGNSPARAEAPASTLVGAWEVTASRARGVGKNLLTFSSDGTFFRSGDTHPVVSGGHGAWKLVGPNQYNASYVSFSFDASGKWIGVNRNNLQLSLGANGDEFTGTVKSNNWDLQEKLISATTSPLAGKRIKVQPF